MIELFVILSTGMIFHSMIQIRDHRIETWMPQWMYADSNWFGFPERWPFKIIDGYHLGKGFSLLLFHLSGLAVMAFLMQGRSVISILEYELIAWIAAWLIFDLFYHVILRKEPTIPFILEWFRETI